MGSPKTSGSSLREEELWLWLWLWASTPECWDTRIWGQERCELGGALSREGSPYSSHPLES